MRQQLTFQYTQIVIFNDGSSICVYSLMGSSTNDVNEQLVLFTASPSPFSLHQHLSMQTLPTLFPSATLPLDADVICGWALILDVGDIFRKSGLKSGKAFMIGKENQGLCMAVMRRCIFSCSAFRTCLKPQPRCILNTQKFLHSKQMSCYDMSKWVDAA